MLNPTIKFLHKLWIDRGYTKEQAQAIAERDYKATGDLYNDNDLYIDSLGEHEAHTAIIKNGFVDITPELDFYDYDKAYKRDNKIYHFGGWEHNFTQIRMIEGAR